MTDQDFNFGAISVLIVDDSRNMRSLLRTLLSALGVENIYDAADGNEAFFKLRDYTIDVVLCDIMMEPLDGIAFALKVRRDRNSPDPFVPIIMVTGYTEQSRVIEARDVGVNEFLAKPISANDLAARIISCIDNPRPFVRSPSYFGPDRRRPREGYTYTGPERRRTGSENFVTKPPKRDV